jgi:hypothetical protein
MMGGSGKFWCTASFNGGAPSKTESHLSQAGGVYKHQVAVVMVALIMVAVSELWSY